MAKVLFSDNAATTATSSLSSGGTSITLTSSAKFPVPTGSDYFYATLYQKPSATEINIEIVKVTANNTGTNTLTISQRDVTNITGSPGSGYAYPGASGTVYVELRWIASDANLLMQAADMTAANVANTPSGGIAATTVQAAINELDTEKANLASANFTVLQVGGVAVPTATDISTAITSERSATRTLTNATLDSSSGKIGSLTGILKAATGSVSAATAGTDYSAGTSALATGLLKSTTTTGALSIAAAGTDYQAPIGTISGIAKGNGANALIAATAGTDYVAPGGALGTPSSGTLTNCTFPTLNQNTTGTAAGLSATLAVGSGGTGITAAGASGNVLTSNGSAWFSSAPAGGGVTSVNGNTGAVTAAHISAAATTGYGYTPANGASYVAKDLGGGNYPVGVIANVEIPSITIVSGGTTAGSNLRINIAIDGTASQNTPSGTWRNLTSSTVGSSGAGVGSGIFQRIA